jgi:hypothetical protein
MISNDAGSEALFALAMQELYSQLKHLNITISCRIPFSHERPEQLQALLYSEGQVLESMIAETAELCIGDSSAD